MKKAIAVLLAAVLTAGAPVARPASAAPPGPTLPWLVTRESQAAVERGLNYLAKSQRADGSWLSGGGYGGTYPTAMTALAGLALLAGGSTPESGPHSQAVKKAMLFVMRQAQQDRDGVIAGSGSEGRSMYGHGFGMLFLAQCYGLETNTRYEKELREVLDKAVALTAKSQSDKGGWIYTPTSNGDEGSVTVTQLQALRACRNAGIKVPKSTIDRAVKYLIDCQNPDGGISYSYTSRGSSRPAISAAAIACFYAAGVYDRQQGGSPGEAEAVERLIRYCRGAVRVGGNDGHYFYTQYYMAQAMYQRGGPDYETYYPEIREALLKRQAADGSWMGDSVGATYGTALACVILQLPYGYLPIYQR